MGWSTGSVLSAIADCALAEDRRIAFSIDAPASLLMTELAIRAETVTLPRGGVDKWVNS